MTNIQDELQRIHHQYGTSEKANYEIQKLFDKEIENRNTWIKVKTLSDLPKQRGENDVFLHDFNGKILVGCTKLLELKDIRNYWLATVTQYQLLKSPKPPTF